MLHAAVFDYYSLPTQATPGNRFKGSLVQGNQAVKVIKRPAYKKRKLEITEYQLYQQQQQSNSYLIPMRWEKHLFTNQIAVCQILQEAKLLVGHVPAIEICQPSSIQHLPKTQKPQAQSAKQHGIATTRQSDSALPIEDLWSEMSKLRSSSFGAVALVADGKGYEHWHLAFEELMEDLLEDGEDILLTIPYTEIREALTYSKELLGHVEEGRLVLRGLDDDKRVFKTETCGDFATVNLRFFSDAVWADPNFDTSKRGSGTNSPEQILYSIHDALREIVDAYYHPQVELNDSQPRKELIKYLADFADYLTLEKKTCPQNAA